MTDEKLQLVLKLEQDGRGADSLENIPNTPEGGVNWASSGGVNWNPSGGVTWASSGGVN